MIAERQGAVTDDLSGLVALAGDQQRIARLQAGNRGPDRLGAIADFLGPLGGTQDRGSNQVRIFVARIVVGDDDAIGIFSCNRPHQRTFAGIAVAAGAEHHNELAFGVRPQRLQRLRQRVGLVRVIDKDRRAVALGDPFQPALRAFEKFERGENRLGLAAGTDRESGGDQRVLDLEFPNQRQPHRMLAPAMFKREFLRKAVDVSLNQTNALTRTVGLAADRNDPQLSRTRNIDHGLRTIMIGRDHRSAIRHHQIAEQPQLGGKIMRDVRMVVHVVAREIGETAGCYAHAVQPILIEPVR